MPKNKNKPYTTSRSAKYQYDVLIPERENIISVLKKIGKPILIDTFFKQFNIKKHQEKVAFQRRLNAMIRDGQLMRDRKKRICLIAELELVLGRVEAHADGYGFLIPDAGGGDYYLSPKEMRHVINGDKILVRPKDSKRGKKEAVFRKVVERVTQIVGQVYKEKDYVFVKPENTAINHSIRLPKEDYNKVNTKDMVVIQLLTHPSTDPFILGKVTKVLGQHLNPGVEVEVAIYNYSIPYVWPDNIWDEEKTCKDKQKGNNLNWQDLTNLAFVTIDGSDARDFDDAVYCEKKDPNNWLLYVAIAHVSYFVEPGSILDKEACNRGNSVYFPMKVIPMLPEFLSNELCSLKPNEKRASVICCMEISNKGQLINYKFFEGWIRSQARLTYAEVTNFFDGKKVRSEVKALGDKLQNLRSLYDCLSKARNQRGALNLEIPETRILYGADSKKIDKIIPQERTVSHKIIEECMLAANVAAAHLLQKQKLPSLYRNHIPPEDEKLQALINQLKVRGIKVPNSITDSKDLANIIEATKDRVDGVLLHTLVLHSLQQANYGPICEGHYGLALPSYTHFTSPIRRYPDLLVYRGICYSIRNLKNDYPILERDLPKIGEHCSATERRADAAVWDVVDWLKCEYMLEHVGQVFEGTITGLTDFGIFVTLNELFVEGLVHITALKDDYYKYDPQALILRGTRGGVTYKLGSTLKVQVAKVNLDERKIDFALVS